MKLLLVLLFIVLLVVLAFRCGMLSIFSKEITIAGGTAKLWEWICIFVAGVIGGLLAVGAVLGVLFFFSYPFCVVV